MNAARAGARADAGSISCDPNCRILIADLRQRPRDGRPVRGRQRRHLLLLAGEARRRPTRGSGTSATCTSTATARSSFVATIDQGTRDRPGCRSRRTAHTPRCVTTSELTSYDNQRLRADLHLRRRLGRDPLRFLQPGGCAADATSTASQGGRFMADDGRTFFATKDALVPRDQNGTITDVYEYVDGRPQLISAGLRRPGLHRRLGSRSASSVSASTPGSRRSATTAPTSTSRPSRRWSAQDQNGEFVKFYDARTGGGFPEEPELLPAPRPTSATGPTARPRRRPRSTAPATSARAATSSRRPRRRARRRRRRSNRKSAARRSETSDRRTMPATEERGDER